jgi:putative transposase
MVRQLRIEYKYAFYHVMSKGNGGQAIYRSNRDRQKFLEYIGLAHDKYGIVIHAYTLMTNHFHLVIETPEANLNKAMHFINTSYTVYYNKKWKKSGHVFQGRYKAILIDKDEYIQQVSRYIHLNPIKAKLIEIPEDYEWSSCKYFVRQKEKPKYLNIKFTLSFFDGSRKKYKNFISDGIRGASWDINKHATAGAILGNENFVNKVRKKFLLKKEETEELVSLKKIKKTSVSKFDVRKALDDSNVSGKELKKLEIYFYKRKTGMSNKEIISKVYNESKHSSLVSKVAARVDEKRRENEKYEEEMRKLEEKMSMSRFDPK